MKTKFDFTIAQRQSLIGVVVLFVNTLQKSIRAFWPMLVVFLFKKEKYDANYIYLGIVAFIVLIAIVAFLKYWFFKFYIDAQLNEFVIESGILNKTKTTIQLHKIQKVDINQSLIQRIFSVHKLEIDTAGSDKKEASINAISQEMALDLKGRLVESAKNSTEKNSQENTEEKTNTFIKIGLPSLIKIGFTANYVTSFAYLFLVYSTISENLRQIGQENLINENVDKLERFPIVTVFLVALTLIILLVLLINLITTVVKYFNFTIKRDNNTFVLSYGLINLKNTIINPNKVQIVKWTQNYFQKKLDVNTIEIKQASSNGQDAKKKDKTKIPGCTDLEKSKILELLLNEIPTQEQSLLPNIRKLIINTFFFLVLPITIAIVFNQLVNRFDVFQVILLISIYTLFVGCLIWFSYRNYRLYHSNNFIVKKSGAWDVNHEIIEPYKIQGIKTSQYFWQKRTNIGSVILYTAGGSISFNTTNYSKLKELVNYWLYQVEISKKSWM